MADVEIGIGKSGRRAYALSEISIVPSRRTRDREDIDTSWRLDAYAYDMPLVAAPVDGITSPSRCADLGRLGAMGVLDLEGLWVRHEDPEPLLLGDPAHLQQAYAQPIDPDLVTQRVEEMRADGQVTAGALRPQAVEEWHSVALAAGLDVLVIRGTIVSAEHVSTRVEPLNLKDFIARYDIPVVVGGCASYSTALHLMRTGAAGILVGVGSARGAIPGVGVPQATAIADAAGARSRHLEETGRNVQIIADGGVETGADVARAIACGADAVMLGSPLAGGDEAIHDLFGALAKSMATCGYATLREFQRAEVVVSAT